MMCVCVKDDVESSEENGGVIPDTAVVECRLRTQGTHARRMAAHAGLASLRIA